MRKKILVTGVLGFIGSNFIHNFVAEYPQYQFIGIDKAVKKYNLNNQFLSNDYKFYLGDIKDEHFIDNVFEIERPNLILHMAAESFVDDSIRNAKEFVDSNIYGTQVLIDAALKYGVEKFLLVSSDEIYGQLKEGDRSWTEEDQPMPRNPYSSSKYCAELILYAANQTHGLTYNITRSCNNFGPRQPPRNLVPKIITCLLNNQPIPIHGSGKQIREWIYVLDHCKAIMRVLEAGQKNTIYNIGSGVELTNLQMVDKIAQALDIKPQINFVKDRAGHDFRYSIDCSRLKNLGWSPSYSFDEGLKKSLQWYKQNY